MRAEARERPAESPRPRQPDGRVRHGPDSTQSRLVAAAQFRFNWSMRNPIIVALDVPTADEALKLVEQLMPVAGGFKVGSELFTSAGPDIGALSEIGLDPNATRQVRRLANMANKAGLRGLVCSAREVGEVRQMLPASTQIVTPGIRAETNPADDQKRTLTPREALAMGANWLVIGRPIYAAENPRGAAEKILASLG